MNDRKILLFLYTLSHFLVDFSCALLIFQEIRSSSFFYQGLFVYNFSAFALQMPLGVLADRIRRSGRIAGIGCLLTALPLLFSSACCIFRSAGRNRQCSVSSGRRCFHSAAFRGALPGTGNFCLFRRCRYLAGHPLGKKWRIFPAVTRPAAS